jgi:hypothetical protein
MMTCRHTQTGWAILIPVVVILAVALGLVNFSADVPRTIPLPVAGLLAAVTLLFATLTVAVNREWLECRFGAGLIWRRIRLSDVRRAEADRNKWYYG